MNKKRKGLITGLFSVLAALFVALMITPAFGAFTAPKTGGVKVEGLQPGDQVTLYKFIETDFDGKNNISYEPIEGVTLTAEQLMAPGADVKALIDQHAASIIQNATVKPSGAVADGATDIEFGNLELGQYLVVVVPNSQNTDLQVYQLSTVNVEPKIVDGVYQSNDTPATVQLKRSPVTVNKTHGDASKTQVTGQYGVGEQVPFTITATVPLYAQEATNKTFKIVDTLSTGLKFNRASLKVFKGEVPLVKDTDYKVTIKDQTVTIDFTDHYVGKFVGGEEVKVTYSATITKDAPMTADGSTTSNTAKLVVSNNPWSTGTYEPSSTTTEKTYGVYFLKKAKQGDSDQATALKGATFKLMKKNAEGTYEDYKVDGEVLQMTTQADGYVHFEKLGLGEYQLVETQAPAGFQTIKHGIPITITKDNATGDFPGTADITETNYLHESDHTDPKIGKLPVTGGPGTIALTIAGICLLAGAGSVAMGNKKKENK